MSDLQYDRLQTACLVAAIYGSFVHRNYPILGVAIAAIAGSVAIGIHFLKTWHV